MSMTTHERARDTDDHAPSLLRLSNISKAFAGTRALSGVDLEIRAGEVHALVGHNGSGKSTLVKILSGYHDCDPGAQAWLEEREVTIKSLAGPRSGDAQRSVSFVHQDLGLILELGAVDNLALHSGFLTGRFGRIDARRQRERAREQLARFDIGIDLDVPLAKVEPIDRTLIAVAAALDGWSTDGGVLVLDEPTSALPQQQIRRLMTVIRGLRAQGAGIVLVSHDLDEVLGIADRITVLRAGQRVATVDARTLDKRGLVRLMLGEDHELMEQSAKGPRRVGGPPVLTLSEISGGPVVSLSLSLGEGEVVGIAGPPGSGADWVPRLLFDKSTELLAGAIQVGGAAAVPASDYRPGAMVNLVPPDRLALGVIGPMSVAENLSLSTLDMVTANHVISAERERRWIGRWIADLAISCASSSLKIQALSGGNQQRVLVGRAMATSPKILLLCNPTEGVDIGARDGLIQFIHERVAEGLSVVVTSNDQADLAELCDRVLIMHRGRVVEEITRPHLNDSTIIRAIERVNDAEDRVV